MFTGLIEETGCVKTFKKLSDGALLGIDCALILDDIALGDSVSINGVCETVTSINQNGFEVLVSNETLKVTTFKDIKQGSAVNLERALKLNSRLGGHIMSGHVDCVGKLIKTEKFSDFYDLTFEMPQEQTRYVVYKGSITVNGISLTVADIRDNIFKIAVIPHTFENTNLKDLKIGDEVNIETDTIARYVEKMLLSKDNETGSKIDIEFLKENGFV